MTLLFLILFFGLFGKLAGFAFRMTWSLMKFMLVIMIVPIIIIAIIGGLVKIALPVLAIVAVVYLIRKEIA